MRLCGLVVVIGLVSGCAGGPEMPRLSEVDLDPAASTASAEPSDVAAETDPAADAKADGVAEADAAPVAENAEKPGLFARLFAQKAPEPAPAAAVSSPAEAQAETAPDAAPAKDDAMIPEVAAAPVAAEPAPEKTGGLLGFFRRQAAQARGAGAAQTAALVPPGSAPAPKAPPGDRFGAVDVEFGHSLPYGQIARLCGVPERKLGKVVDQHPAKGRAVFRIIDSKPDQTGLRPLYITGFRDGCARQFTAALAVFGDFETHERLRYGLPSGTIPESETDVAYETLKRRECGAAKNKPCGSRMAEFARRGVFVSLYERFEGSPRWKNVLLHDGEVVAFDVANH